MKKGYWLIVVFTIWCAACAVWYMFGVKGISNDPVHFSPQPPLVAIVEILFMITGGFLMGFGLAWLMREAPFVKVNVLLRQTDDRLKTSQQELALAKNEVEVWQRKWEQAEEKVAQTLTERENGMKQIDDTFRQLADMQKMVQEHGSRAQQLDGEVNSARFRIRLLENDVVEKETLVRKLSEALKEEQSKPHPEHRDWSDHPFVRPVEVDLNEKDDLTAIKGIGPAFQKKLNALDIYSFRELSELSGESVQRLAEAIEVFPERIHRDNWIGQATRLYLKKMESL